MIAVRVGARRHIEGFVYALDDFEINKKRSASPATPCRLGPSTGLMVEKMGKANCDNAAVRRVEGCPLVEPAFAGMTLSDGPPSWLAICSRPHTMWASITYWLSPALGQDKFPGWNLESGVPPRRRVRTGSGRFSEGHRFPPAEPQTGQLLEAAALPRKGRRMPDPSDSAFMAPVAINFREQRAAGDISPELAQRILQYDGADTALCRFYTDTYNPIAERHRLMVEAIPHIVREIGPSIHTVRWSTANLASIDSARSVAHTPPPAGCNDKVWWRRHRDARSFYAAHLRRTRALATAQKDSGFHSVEEREKALWEPVRAAYRAVLDFPAASLADLSAKLDFVAEVDDQDANDIIAMAAADVTRLAGSMGQ